MWEMLAFQAEISYNIYVKSVLAHLVSIVSFRSLVGVLYLNLKVQDSYQMYSDKSLFIPKKKGSIRDELVKTFVAKA